ncbi:MAG: hypothetical protein ACU84J_03960 [Gammaproteobacteria bacterium]
MTKLKGDIDGSSGKTIFGQNKIIPTIVTRAATTVDLQILFNLCD